MMKVKWVNHGSSPMFLLLAVDEKHLAETEWFKDLVRGLRWILPVMTKVNIRANNIPKIIRSLIADLYVNKEGWKKGIKAIGEQGGSGEASAFINAILSDDWDDAVEVFKDWLAGTMELQLKGISTLMPQHFNENWVVESAYVAPTEDATMYCFKLEFEGDSTAKSEEEALSDFINQIVKCVDYWSRDALTPAEASDGTAFGILNIIDGYNVEYPSVKLTLSVPENAKAVSIENQADYYVDGTVLNRDIALHDEYSEATKE